MNHAYNELRQMIQNLSYRKAANQDEAFTLASGKKSMHYFDLKRSILKPEGFKWMSEALWTFLNDKKLLNEFQGAGGLTLGADPLAYAVAMQSVQHQNPKYPLIVRKTEKGHGLKRRIEGYIDEVQQVLVLDDVVTTGGSSIQAVEAFRAAGKEVKYCIAIVDRLEGGKENMQEIGVELLSLYNLLDFDK